METIRKTYIKYRNFIDNVAFPILLLVYPLLKINQGIDVTDTTYSLGNFQYFDTMKGTWMVATFLANAVGHLLQQLPFGGTLMGMYFYTGLLQAVLAFAAYFSLKKKIPAPAVFVGELMALGLCWCPSTILYNYLTYLLMLCGALLLYRGVLTECGVPEKRVLCLAAAGLCLGANVAVRMPNVVQMAFIVVVWYGAVLVKTNRSRVVRDTLWCILGYAVGFGIPLAAICFKYGVSAYPDMVKTMFAMTDTATDYKPASMLTGMFGDYVTGLYWLMFAAVCMATGWILLKVQATWFRRESADFDDNDTAGNDAPTGKMRAAALGCRSVYVALLLVLLRFYWGRGVFSFRYYEYSSIYYPAVLLLSVGILMAVVCLVQKKTRAEQKVLALLVLVQIFVTPLGSNNDLYPIINNLFLVLPFMLWMACDWRQAPDVDGGTHGSAKLSFVWKAPFAILVAFVCVQSIGFHMNFVFQDGMQGEERTVCISTPAKAARVYTGEDNGEMLQEMAAFVETEELAGRALITYGELPGLGYLLDMPPALSTFWCDLDSYRMVEYERDMAQLENAIAQDGTGAAPVIILSSETAAYLSEDADAMNWFGVDQDAFAVDEKLQILGAFMTKYNYQEQFANGRYAVYECVTDAD